MSFASLLSSPQVRGGDAAALGELARAALADGEEERALPLISNAAARLRDAGLWQWKGLLERALDRHQEALESLGEAARLAPTDAGIAHGHARVALEAGIDAVPLFAQARRLAPGNGDVLLGLQAARMAVGAGEEAIRELDSILAQAPFWVQGQVQLAQLRSMLGQAEQATASLDRALAGPSPPPALWQALFEILVKRGDFVALEAAVARARASAAPAGLLDIYAAIAAAECGEVDRADRLFAKVAASGGPPMPLWRIRHLLRSGRVDEALPLIDEAIAGTNAADAWPYAAAAWQLADDPRWRWLESDERLVSVAELTPDLPPIERLADVLRGLHVARGEYLDQSVRGGTQTDGPLFSRIEPEVRALRTAVVSAVHRYVAQLPPPDPQHPLLAPPRNRPVRFSGSWSVRLRGAGYHENHVHPQGWISSALYVALPGATPEDLPEAGWLTLGQPSSQLKLGLASLRRIKPVPGRLVLFPSWMWHGTVPFREGERLTVAFDVARPARPAG